MGPRQHVGQKSVMEVQDFEFLADVLEHGHLRKLGEHASVVRLVAIERDNRRQLVLGRIDVAALFEAVTEGGYELVTFDRKSDLLGWAG